VQLRRGTGRIGPAGKSDGRRDGGSSERHRRGRRTGRSRGLDSQKLGRRKLASCAGAGSCREQAETARARSYMGTIKQLDATGILLGKWIPCSIDQHPFSSRRFCPQTPKSHSKSFATQKCTLSVDGLRVPSLNRHVLDHTLSGAMWHIVQICSANRYTHDHTPDDVSAREYVLPARPRL
jgi:hypothetical protein